MPEPVGTCAAAGTCALEKVMVWPFTFRVDPSRIRLAVVAALVVRALPTVTLPEPLDVVRPSSFSRSALPMTLRSAPVDELSVRTPVPALMALVEPVITAAPAVITVLATPLARSTALSTSAKVANGAAFVPR
jgi:hypothetical protein